MQVLKRGSRIGPYIILETVPGGVGGMATVYKARLGKKGPIVALKVAHKGMGDFLKDEGAFLKAQQLNHPNIIKILPTPLLDGSREYIVKDANTGSWYFAMEYLEGGDLDRWMQARKRLSMGEAFNITMQIGQALDVAHQAGILHLDVKPSNILFRADPRNNGHTGVVLTDFGIARPEGRIASGQTLTVEYASPEQARRAQGEPLVIGKAADIYSLAVIFYEMLSGRLPFQAKNDTALLHHIVYETPDWNIEAPNGLIAVLERALAKDPEERFGSAREFVLELRKQIPTEMLQIVPQPVNVALAMRRKLSPFFILLLGMAVGLGIGTSFGYYWGAGNSQTQLPTPSPTVYNSIGEATPTLPSHISIEIEIAVTPTSTAIVSEVENTREPTSTPAPTATPRPTQVPLTPTPEPPSDSP